MSEPLPGSASPPVVAGIGVGFASMPVTEPLRWPRPLAPSPAPAPEDSGGTVTCPPPGTAVTCPDVAGAWTCVCPGWWTVGEWTCAAGGTAVSPVRTAGASTCATGGAEADVAPTAGMSTCPTGGAVTGAEALAEGTSTRLTVGALISVPRPTAAMSTRPTDGSETSVPLPSAGTDTCPAVGRLTWVTPTFTDGRSLTRAPTGGASSFPTTEPCDTEPSEGTLTWCTAGALIWPGAAMCPCVGAGTATEPSCGVWTWPSPPSAGVSTRPTPAPRCGTSTPCAATCPTSVTPPGMCVAPIPGADTAFIGPSVGMCTALTPDSVEIEGTSTTFAPSAGTEELIVEPRPWKALVLMPPIAEPPVSPWTEVRPPPMPVGGVGVNPERFTCAKEPKPPVGGASCRPCATPPEILLAAPMN
ncbi:predicted protein [Streptomyces sp. SPB78]|nr:predicted protein [Streptomyces sp. SPB78]